MPEVAFFCRPFHPARGPADSSGVWPFENTGESLFCRPMLQGARSPPDHLLPEDSPAHDPLAFPSFTEDLAQKTSLVHTTPFAVLLPHRYHEHATFLASGAAPVPVRRSIDARSQIHCSPTGPGLRAKETEISVGGRGGGYGVGEGRGLT